MDLTFKPVTAEDMERLGPFYGLRPNKTCDSVFLDCFLWKDYYHVKCAVSEDQAVLWLMEKDGRISTAMPMCREEELPYFFSKLVEYFEQDLHKPFYISLADQEAVEYLKLDPAVYEVTEQADLKDYLYDGNALRTLAGKKLHKKKNLVNAFMKEYAGRYEYRRLYCYDRIEVWQFMERWKQQKAEAGEIEDSLDHEVRGIHEILKNCPILTGLNVRMAGVYLDGRLEAFTIGSLNELENMAVIHIEKANSEVKGLYQFINQQFLVNEFPEAVLVNREDDVGMEGLRKAKMSYHPIGFARKYMVKKR
ncbi:MAG: DUF2156 domain-containing protein [Lachnospiraceae bacterium]|nr:DUF2156 domain-containing protein [Lachnospiraceae bacterium]